MGPVRKNLTEVRITQPEKEEKAMKTTFRIAFWSRGFTIQKTDLSSMIRIHKEKLSLNGNKTGGGPTEHQCGQRGGLWKLSVALLREELDLHSEGSHLPRGTRGEVYIMVKPGSLLKAEAGIVQGLEFPHNHIT